MKKILKGFTIAISVLIVFIIITGWLLPVMLPSILSNQGEKRDIALTIDDINIRWFKGIIEINDLTFGTLAPTSKAPPPAQIAEIFVDLNLAKLWFGEMSIENVRIDQATFEVALENDVLTINGINPEALANPSESNIDPIEDEPTSEPLVWSIDNIELGNIDVSFVMNGETVPFNLSALTVGTVDSRQPEYATPIYFDLLLNNTQFAIDLDAEILADIPHIMGSIAVSNVDFSRWLPIASAFNVALPSVLNNAEGQLDTRAWIDISVDSGEVAVSVDDLTVALLDLHLSNLTDSISLTAGANLAIETLTYQTNQLTFSALDLTLPSLHVIENSMDPQMDMAFADLSLTIGQLHQGDTSEITNIVLNTGLSDYGTLNFKGDVSMKEDTANRTELTNTPHLMGTIAVSNVNFSRWLPIAYAFKVELPSALNGAEGQLDTLASIDIAIHSEQVAVSVDDLSVALLDLQLPNLTDSVSLTTDANLVIGTFTYQSNQVTLTSLDLALPSLHLIETSIDPEVDMAFADFSLNINRLYQGDTSEITDIVVSSRLGDYGTLNFDGDVSMKDNKVDATGKFLAQQIDLIAFSGYAKQVVGRHIDSGSLDLDLTLDIKADQLNSAVDIQAHQLYLGGEYPAKENSFTNELGMPINTALNLLRDKNETIQLNLPIQGNLENPEFKISRIVNKAILNATKTVVISQFGPLALFSAASKTLDFAESLKLKPILFPVGSSELADTEQEKLDALKTLLTKRPSLRVTVCGYAVNADEQETPELLAEERATVIKKALIETDIDSTQLIGCAPKIDTAEDAKPRVVVSF